MEKSPLVVGLGGSLRQKSYSRAALCEALRIAEAEGGAATELLDVRKLNLPMFVPDLQVQEYSAAYQMSINQLLAACRRADVTIWASPTYHGTISGALKNALDFTELL